MFEEWDFNEASISSIELNKDFTMHLSDVQPEDQIISNNLDIVITINDVHSLFIDDKKVTRIDFPKYKGEIINVDINDTGLDFIVEWTNYNIHPFKRLTLAYRILGVSSSVKEKL